ncbi:hypothetical protein SARC_12167 [Sphaeroforma arctica JP610]|uniref:Cytochrome P450 n=1 Tax=Sphaeroforma arctica JP610 TaxID=667725 RepID=A0A0L0FEV0_9EUKA|nr:hypothetical protein SARC_12167 [Sphaeroforma arctica JP610]KNC75304.1 hypothetical protein SARC_12167 [Sphaeroforma arctica JP610]|eukprot:XP_014149206.1 hypothetical protein SARC_12167 [Sphaeroforma arctica JP610]
MLCKRCDGDRKQIMGEALGKLLFDLHVTYYLMIGSYGREIIQPLTTADGYTILTGSHLIVPFSTMRSPRVYLNPDEIQPQRHNPEAWAEFSPEYVEQANQFEAQKGPDWVRPGQSGFGAGAHPCVGKRFAMMEISIVVSALVARFGFERVQPKVGLPAHDNDQAALIMLPKHDVIRNYTAKSESGLVSKGGE